MLISFLHSAYYSQGWARYSKKSIMKHAFSVSNTGYKKNRECRKGT